MILLYFVWIEKYLQVVVVSCILYYNATIVEDFVNVPDTVTVWCKLILSNVNFDWRLLLCYFSNSGQ